MPSLTHRAPLYALLFTLSLPLGACEDQKKKDAATFCELAAANADSQESAEVTWQKIVTEYAPVSELGKSAQTRFTSSTADQADEVSREAFALIDPKTPWSCAALESLSKRAVSEREAAAQLEQKSRCGRVEPVLDQIAYTLVPLLRAEIPGVIKEHVPAERQEEVTRVFEQEVAVRLKQQEEAKDPSLDARRAQILDVLGCNDTPRQEDACKELVLLVPQITNNQRIVSIGEAYGVALTRAGLDPSQFVMPLQTRLQEVSSQHLAEELAPHMKTLAEITECTFL